MKRVKTQKIWRVNVWVNFLDKKITHLNRERTQAVLSHLAWLYRLDYAISFDHPVSFEYDSENNMLALATQDLFFFRSTIQTRVSAPEFRGIVNGIFSAQLNIFEDGFCVNSDLMKNLKQNPFPESYSVFGY